MADYTLTASVPYEPDCHLFSGTEDDLKDFIRKNTSKERRPSNYTKKGFIEVIRICGYNLYDLSVTIEGPDITSYLDV